MIVVVAGVAGSGKTTVGQLLARRLGWQFADADRFHPAANVAKMRAGMPLTDDDRKPWLAAIDAWMDDIIASGQSAVLACSALKRKYRDDLVGHREQAVMVFLAITQAQDQARLHARKGHFFHEPLLASQFAALEPPEPDEPRVYSIPTGDAPPGQVVTEIITKLGSGLSAD
ncbi:MAG TPA: gluconokinase [Streptosporangiaceae bacterium]|jgi:gluconokinase|nr:gluconokinase [Streptosporangiaceae bacterium]